MRDGSRTDGVTTDGVIRGGALRDGDGRDGDGRAGAKAVSQASIIPGEVSSKISRTMVQLYRERLGRGPTKARTTANVNTVMVAFEETLTTAERTLLGEGRDEPVLSMRQALAETMRADAVEAIESLVGRKVRAYVSGLDPDANVAVQIFLLDELPETGELGVSEATPDGEVAKLA